jgi:hypothetical protein
MGPDGSFLGPGRCRLEQCRLSDLRRGRRVQRARGRSSLATVPRRGVAQQLKRCSRRGWALLWYDRGQRADEVRQRRARIGAGRLAKHDTRGVKVTCDGRRLTLQYLGREVFERAEDEAGLRQLGRVLGLGDAEVRQACTTIGAEQNVPGFTSRWTMPTSWM